MWLFLVETYLFVLVAFTLGVAVGLVGVRVGPEAAQGAVPEEGSRSEGWRGPGARG
jgi:hypothetical protein